MSRFQKVLEHLATLRGYVDREEARACGVVPEAIPVAGAPVISSGGLPPEFQSLLDDTTVRTNEEDFHQLERHEVRVLLHLLLHSAEGVLETTTEVAVGRIPDDDEDDTESETVEVQRLLGWARHILQHEAGDPLVASEGQVDTWRQKAVEYGCGRLVRAKVAGSLVDLTSAAPLSEQFATELAHHQTQSDLLNTKVLEANLRLALHYAYGSEQIPLRQSLGAAMGGLLRAIDLFEPLRGYMFSTYASHWIRQCVIRAVANFSRPVRIPVHALDKVARARRALSRVDPEQRASLSPSELAVLWDTEEVDVARIRASARPVVVNDWWQTTASDAPIESIWSPIQLSPAEVSSAAAQPGRLVDLSRLLQEEIKSSGDAGRQGDARIVEILQCRLGLGRTQTETLKEIGDRHNVSRERIRQLESDGLARVKRSLQRQGRL